MTSRATTFRLLWLQLNFAVRHLNPLTGCAFALMLGAALLALLWLPQQRNALALAQQNLAQIKQNKTQALTQERNEPPVLSVNQQRVSQFYEILGSAGYAEQQLKTLFAIAEKNNLKLSQGDYRNALDRNSGVASYQIDLPVTGPYPSIRLFCEEALRAIPFASLDQISFKRQAIGSAALDARVVLTLYLAPDKSGTAGQP